MSTILHAIFGVTSDSLYFVVNIFNIQGRKMRYSASSPFSILEKSSFGHFEVVFLNV